MAEETEPAFSILGGIPRMTMVNKDLLDARHAVEGIGLPLPTDFRSSVEGVRLLADLLKLLLCFPECDALIRELVKNRYPQNWPNE